MPVSVYSSGTNDVPVWMMNADNPLQMPIVASSLDLNDMTTDNFTKKQIHNKILECFHSWRPWQQKMLLCGLTNRWAEVIFKIAYVKVSLVFVYINKIIFVRHTYHQYFQWAYILGITHKKIVIKT